MDLEKLKVVELRTELAQRGLDTKGVKSVLVERLRKAIEEENANLSSEGKNADEEDTYDDAAQESDEKATKSTRALQTPKKSSRLSKSAPLTPREDSAAKKRRTSRLTYSRRRTSPKKLDQNDMSRETSPVPSESTLQDEGTNQEDTILEVDAQEEAGISEKVDIKEDAVKPEEPAVEKDTAIQDEPIIEKDASKEKELAVKSETAKQEVLPASPEKQTEKDRKSLSIVEKEGTNSMEVVEENETTNDESPAVESPVKSSDKNELTTEESKDDKDAANENDKTVESTSNKEISENADLMETEAVASDANKNNTQNEDNKSCEDTHDIKEQFVQRKVENVDSMDSNNIAESINEAKTTEILEPKEQSKDVLEDEESKDVLEDEVMKDILEDEESKDILEDAESKDILEDEELKDVQEDEESKDVLEDEQSKDVLGDEQSKDVLDDEESKDLLEEEQSKDLLEEEQSKDLLEEEQSKDLLEEEQSKDSLEEEQSKDVLEEEQDIDINENDKLKAEDEFLEVEESEKGAEDNADDKRDEEDIEMSEIKQEEDTEVEMKEPEDANTNTVARDKKRKRSPSPLEYRHESPPPVSTENEPEIDDSALILSWYDSDLNLVIDKDGFFTATPMHNDGFSHMWAGARASYGFLCGKVYYEAKIVEYCTVNAEKEQPHVLRIGWSTPYTSMQLGEEKFSFGYSSTGKKLTDNQYEDYGLEFGKDDVIGCYCDATSDNVVLSYTVNGKDQGTAFSISKEELGDKPLFPHILSKNCTFACNFGQETPWNKEILQDYVSIGNVESQYKIPGLRRPQKKDECEVIMMCGLPACGKTTWATKYATEHPQKMYNILGLGSLINKMKDPGQSYKEEYVGEWKKLIDKCTDALDRLMEIASSRRRNYILDQINAYPSAQRRKMKNFSGYQRKAVVIVSSEEEYKSRGMKQKPIDGKEVTDSMLLEIKANFRAPVVGESFDLVDWVELNQEEGAKIIEKYNKEGVEAGYGEQQINKRARTDSRSGITNESRSDLRSSRDNRDNRDYRDRRNSYSDRNRNPVWRGGSGNMGWRDRPQRGGGGGGGHTRHGGGYGSQVPRRRRGAPIPLVHRGMNRRGGNADRRGGNDRGRALVSRQGPRSRAPIGNYQGSQQPVWNQQNSWPSQSQEGWGQQSNWGSSPSWGSWKGYGQGSYNQNNYQQGYGNGNWNSWNQQYYSQYWGQQQQSGQTTTSSGQAANKQ